MKPEGRSRLRRGRISRRSMFAQPRVLQYRLCTRNSSFARGKLLAIVRRSLRRYAPRLFAARQASTAKSFAYFVDCLQSFSVMTYRFFLRRGGCFRRERFSLRLGHTRVLTPHRGVIHYARVASLPPPYGFVCLLFVRRYAFVADRRRRPPQKTHPGVSCVLEESDGDFFAN